MEAENPDVSSVPSIHEYLAILRRRRAIILQAFVIIAVVGTIQTLLTKPTFQASARMLVEGPAYNLNTVDSSNPLSSLFQLSQQQTVETQVEVLQAAPLLDTVSKLVGPAGLTVDVVKDTNVIEVTGESNSPRTAADAPNALLRLYISQDTEQSLAEMERARQFIAKQGLEAHKKLAETETALESFKQRNHVVELTKNRDDQIARVTALTDARQTAQMNLTTLRAQIASAQNELKHVPPATAVTTQATNPAIAVLQDSLRALEVQRVGLIQPGGLTPRAPQVRALDAQIADLKQRLSKQPTLIASRSISSSAFRQTLEEKIADLEAQVPVSQTQVALATQALTEASARTGKYAGLELTLDRLTREHDAAQTADRNFTD